VRSGQLRTPFRSGTAHGWTPHDRTFIARLLSDGEGRPPQVLHVAGGRSGGRM